jgi:hypothetical protein
MKKPGIDLGKQHHQQEKAKINQSSKQQIHYQSSLAKPLPIAILLCRTQV